MIPKVQVPMDFGLQYLGSPSHGNLRFSLAGGEELFANSMIISYNSPVIERITTELLQTTVEAEDFAKEAVQCFLEASYSGQLKVSKSNFRNVNKMVHVFDVSWMVMRCCAYFTSLVEEVKEDNFDDQLYVFEEAMYIMTTLKKRSFIDVVLERFSSLTNCTQFFVPQYLSDISFCSTKHLDVIIDMVGKQRHILIEVLNNHLTKNTTVIDRNARFLLEHVNFTACNITHQSLCRRLFDNLEGIENTSKEDWTLIVKLLKQSHEAMSPQIEELPKYVKIPNLFHSFSNINGIEDFDELTNFLIESPLVTNTYVFFDAVYSWIDNKKKDVASCPVTITDDFITKLTGAMSKRGWPPLAKGYCIANEIKFGGFAKRIVETENLTTEEGYYRIISTDEYSPDKFFLADHDIKFRFKHPATGNCARKGDCGFILHVTAASTPDSFNIQLVIDQELYPSDLHFHEHIQHLTRTMHFALDEIRSLTSSRLDHPVTWFGKPQRDGTGKYWMWGGHRFYKKGEGSTPSGDEYKWSFYKGEEAKIIPVIYYFG